MKELQQAYQKAKEANSQSSAELQFCHFYKELHAILGRDPITTPQTTVDASEELKSQTPAMNGEEEKMDKEEEEKYGGHVTGGSTYAMSQDLVLTPPQYTQSQQSSTGEPDAGEETLAAATAALRVSPSTPHGMSDPDRKRKKTTRDAMFSEFLQASTASDHGQRAWRMNTADYMEKKRVVRREA
ncbi:small integral membrane protein 14 isoform X1 [Mauremys mutica]|uniref:small integral membrane protein 14 isoform X1 n=1 Tax=Mauremys mutica TaxID=74926 RepID=UPI001D164E0B|nr:small integral membrane protein 14 isoform X1 [Mauremys mutica]